MEALSDYAKAAIAAARAKGATQLLDELLGPCAMMPSVEQLEAELGRDFFEQFGNVAVIGQPHDGAAR